MKPRKDSLKKAGTATSELCVILGAVGALGVATAIGLYFLGSTGRTTYTWDLWGFAVAALLVFVLCPLSVIVTRCLASRRRRPRATSHTSATRPNSR
jgi:hypothetical protein